MMEYVYNSVFLVFSTPTPRTILRPQFKDEMDFDAFRGENVTITIIKIKDSVIIIIMEPVNMTSESFLHNWCYITSVLIIIFPVVLPGLVRYESTVEK